LASVKTGGSERLRTRRTFCMWSPAGWRDRIMYPRGGEGALLQASGRLENAVWLRGDDDMGLSQLEDAQDGVDPLSEAAWKVIDI